MYTILLETKYKFDIEPYSLVSKIKSSARQGHSILSLSLKKGFIAP